MVTTGHDTVTGPIAFPGKFVHADQMLQYMRWNPGARDEEHVKEMFRDLQYNGDIKDDLLIIKEYKQEVKGKYHPTFSPLIEKHENQAVNGIIDFLRKKNMDDLVPARSRAYGSISALPSFTRLHVSYNHSSREMEMMVMPREAHVDAMLDAMAPTTVERINFGTHAANRKRSYRLHPMQDPRLNRDFYNNFRMMSVPTTVKREVLIQNWIENDKQLGKDSLVEDLFISDFSAPSARAFNPDKADDVYVPLLLVNDGPEKISTVLNIETMKSFLEKKRNFFLHETRGARIKDVVDTFVKNERKETMARYNKEEHRATLKKIREEMAGFMKNEAHHSAFTGLARSHDENIMKEGVRKALLGASVEGKMLNIDSYEHLAGVLSKIVSLNKHESKRFGHHDLNDEFPTSRVLSGLHLEEKIRDEGFDASFVCHENPYSCMRLGSITEETIHFPDERWTRRSFPSP